MSAYIRNPKEPGGTRHLALEDEEDFAQESAIREWLEREGRVSEFEYSAFTRKGTARSLVDRKSVRLEQKVRDEPGSRTYADIIAGSDGRDLECRLDPDEADDGPETAADRLEAELDLFFDAIGASEGMRAWGKKSVKSAESIRSLRQSMKDDERLEISMIDLESLKQWPNFRK